MSIAENLLEFAKNYDSAYIVGNIFDDSIIFFNKFAQNIYHITEERQSVDQIFGAIPEFFRENLQESLTKKVSVIYPDFYTRLPDGSKQLADLHIGYFNAEKTQYFLEITPKIDNELVLLIDIVATGQKPSFILNFDMDYSFCYVNMPFSAKFLKNNADLEDNYHGSFLSFLEKNDQVPIIEKLTSHLEKESEFHLDLLLKNEDNTETWYYLDVQKCILGSGDVKLMGFLVEITHHKQKSQKLEQMHNYFNALQELSDDLLFIIDIPNQSLIRRGDWAKMFGLAQTVTNFPYSILNSGIVHPDDYEKYENFGKTALDGKAGSVELRMKQQNDNFSYYKLVWTPVLRDDGSVVEMFGKVVSVQSLRDLEEKANFDALTNTFNKETMCELTSKILNESTLSDYHALFFIDIDDFKYVNDQLGHTFGDYLLKELGKRFIQNTRSGDYIGRVGGDEFVIFLRDISSSDLLIQKAKIILNSINELISKDNKAHSVHASIGIAMYPDHGRTYEELYQCADLALYRSKGLGKNIATMFRPSSDLPNCED